VRRRRWSWNVSGSFDLAAPHLNFCVLPRSVNIPWPTGGVTDADYIYAFMRIVMPIAYEFAPELVISEFRVKSVPARNSSLTLLDRYTVSAGFDAADGDTLGECHVTPSGYAHMTHMLSSLANGKLVVALEVRNRSYSLKVYVV
jgi:histone deacetylase 6